MNYFKFLITTLNSIFVTIEVLQTRLDFEQRMIYVDLPKINLSDSRQKRKWVPVSRSQLTFYHPSPIRFIVMQNVCVVLERSSAVVSPNYSKTIS